MSSGSEHSKLKATWARIESLGGSGVWEPDFVVVSFAKTGIRDTDLAVLEDFSVVQTLDLSDTQLTDACLKHLSGLAALEELIVANTKISDSAIKEFRRAHPSVKVVTGPPPTNAINPFTGKPF